jgi:hypothetical protein
LDVNLLKKKPFPAIDGCSPISYGHVNVFRKDLLGRRRWWRDVPASEVKLGVAMKKHLAVALAIGAASLAFGADQASAATNLGTISLNQINSSGSSMNYSLSYSSGSKVASFWDVTVSGSQTQWMLTFAFAAPTDINPFTLGLYNTDINGNPTGAAISTGTSVLAGSQRFATLNSGVPFSLSAPGTYAIEVYNTSTAPTANDTGALTVTTSVPETSTWLMMVAGFVGLGFVGARRQGKERLAA